MKKDKNESIIKNSPVYLPRKFDHKGRNMNGKKTYKIVKNFNLRKINVGKRLSFNKIVINFFLNFFFVRVSN